MTRGILAFLIAFALTLLLQPARGRDDGRLAGSPLKEFFDSLTDQLNNGCCSKADGQALADPDWKVKDGKYFVYLGGEWLEVPPEKLVKQTNEYGPAMVWPIKYESKDQPVRYEIRCFMPGTMS